MNTTSKKKKTLLALSFMLPVIIAFIGLILGRFAPFGGKDVYTAGGYSNVMAFYYELNDKLYTGASVLTGSLGNAYNDFGTTIAYYISDPLNLIAVLFPKRTMPTVLNIIYILKIGCAGLFFCMLLSYKKTSLLYEKANMEEKRKEKIAAYKAKLEAKKLKKKNQKKDFKIGSDKETKNPVILFFRGFDFPVLAFSMAYSLSSFMLSKGMNTGYLTVAALFPLLIMGIDKIVRENKWLLYTIAFTLSLFGNFHLALVAFIISLIYFLIQDYKEPQHFMKSLLYKLMSDALSIAMAAIVIIPAIKNAEFKESFSIKFPIFTTFSSIFDTLKTQVMGFSPSSISYYSLGTDIYAGIFVLLLVCLFLLNRNITVLRRLKALIPITILLFGHVFSSLNYILNGFYFSDKNLNLYDFAFIAIVLLLSYEEYINIEHTRTLDIHLSLLISAALTMLALFKSYHVENIAVFYYSSAFLLAVYLLILIYRSNSMTKSIFRICLGFLIILEIIPTFFIAIRKIKANTADSRFTTDYAFFMARKHILAKDPDASILTYSRSNPNFDPVLSAIEGYDYVIADKNLLDEDFLPLEEEFYNIYIYKNELKYDTPVYTPYDITSWKLSDSNYFESLNLLLSSYLYGKDAYTVADGEFMSSQDTYVRPEGVEDNYTSYFIFKFKPYGSGDLYGHYNDQIVSHGYMDEEGIALRYFFSSKYLFKNGNMNVRYAFFDADAMKENISNSLVCQKNDKGSFKINAPYNGSILVPIDTYSDLKICNNNETVYGTKVNKNLISIPVLAGENDILINVDRTYLVSSILISLIGVLLLALILIKNLACNISTFAVNNKTIRFIVDNRMYIYCFTISFMIATIMLIIVSVAPFGDNALGNADTYQQWYSSTLLSYINAKNNHYSLFATNSGLFSDTYSGFISSIIYPFSRIINYLLPESLYTLVFALKFIISFSIGGPSLIFYLSHRRYSKRIRKTDKRILIYGLTYSLCSYSVVYFGYCNFSFLKILPIVILGLEILVKENKPALYIATLFITVDDPYYGFMTCMFLFFYFLTFKFDDIKDFYKKSVRFGLASIAGAGLHAYTLIPYFLKTRESLYLVADAKVQKSSVGTNYLNTIQEFQIFNEQASVTTVFYKINIYCGILFLMTFPVYLLLKKVPMQVRIKKILLIVLYYLAFNNETLNYIFHGFHNQTMVPNRFSIFIIFMLITMGIDIIENLEEVNKKNVLRVLAISSITILSIWAIPNIGKTPDMSYIVSVLFVIIYLNIFYFLYFKKDNNKHTKILLVFLLIFEVLLNCFGTMFRHVGAKAVNIDNVYTIREIEKKYPDMLKADVNSELINSDLNNIGNFTGINTLSTFNSSLTMAHANIVAKWNQLYSANVIYYPLGNLLSDMMLHIKYHLADMYDTYSGSYYEKIGQVANIEIYEADTYLPMGVFFNNNDLLTKWDMSDKDDYSNSLKYQNAFSNSLGYGDIYNIISLEEYDKDKTYTAKDNFYQITKSDTTTTTNEVYGTINYNVAMHLSAEIKGDLYIGYGDFIFYGGRKETDTDEILEITIPSPSELSEMSFGIANKENLKALYQDLSRYTLQNISSDWNSIDGTITTPAEGTIYISLPNLGSFETYVDGKIVNHSTFLGGIGIPVTSGDHKISLVYTPRGMYGGFIVTFCTIALLIFTSYITKRNKKKDAKTVA